ncbi:hypothetical protein AERO8C_20469 [Aeromonas veronii]|uniref:Uncharacterized protein n=1 Tax=Aeromonas veronii TaxID=654 RepID=A0A653L1S3_AERVE|nr:hypothetical protein AERO8C_20469 [Aeromonas veronii]
MPVARQEGRFRVFIEGAAREEK